MDALSVKTRSTHVKPAGTHRAHAGSTAGFPFVPLLMLSVLSVEGLWWAWCVRVPCHTLRWEKTVDEDRELVW